MSTDVVARLRAAGCVFAEDEAALLVEAATSPAELESLVERRAAGLPLEHLLGWVEFHGRRIAVEPGVFVPRQRTGLLVDLAAERLRRRPARDPAVVVDLCCGCGAVGLALSDVVGAVELYAVDVEPAAVACARRNIAPAVGRVLEGDLYQPLPAELRGRVAIVTANAPYVPTGAIGFMPPEAREYEPLVALDGGADGLDIARRVMTGAARWLAPGGAVLVEASADQAPALAEAVSAAGLSAEVAVDEDLDATVVIGTAPLG